MRIIAYTLVFFLSRSVLADSWGLLYTADGFSVYESKEERLPKYLARGKIKMNFYHLLVILSDIPRRIEWVDRLSEIRIVEGDNRTRLVVYNRLNLPWPIADRDSVLLATIERRPEHRVAVIHLENMESAAVPPVPGVVRVERVLGRTTLRYIDQETTEVSEELMFDPSGFIPRWVAKIMVEDAPIQTLRGLLRQAQKTKGQYDLQIEQMRKLEHSDKEVPQ